MCATGRAHKPQCISCYKAAHVATVLGPYSNIAKEAISLYSVTHQHHQFYGRKPNRLPCSRFNEA